jgi:hypothetical protein
MAIMSFLILSQHLHVFTLATAIFSVQNKDSEIVTELHKEV